MGLFTVTVGWKNENFEFRCDVIRVSHTKKCIIMKKKIAIGVEDIECVLEDKRVKCLT